MRTLEEINQELENIKSRNQVVEADKAWETSWSRRLALMIFTYLILGIYMGVIQVSKPWLNAIVPTIGFMLSTLTLPIAKKIWLEYIYKK